ncbi:MAG TPA: S49 family peptidase, partial [Candidatus Limnocylindrales bacterium]|nr:S49 family peptidase [Candidatus Limnocylindrales bacterium]
EVFSVDPIITEVWAIQPAVLAQIRAYLAGDASLRAALARPPDNEPPKTQALIGVVPIHGVIEHRSSWLMEIFGGASVETISAQLRAAVADPDVRAVVLDIDSPGGSVAGITELAEEIRAARKVKRVYAVANTTMASAAFWLGAQASAVYATPSAQVGSIGIFGVHMDFSRALDAEGITATVFTAGEHKAEESPYQPLTDDAKAEIQARTDAYYDQFIGDVAKGRGVTAAKVKADYGQGRVLMPAAALEAGMIDGIETFDDVLRLISRQSRAGGLAAAGEGVELEADDDPGTLPFRDGIELLAADALRIRDHGLVRAGLRAKEGRPPFSEEVLASLRSTRDAIDALLPADPAPARPPAVDPPPAPPAAAVAAPVVPMFRSDEEWLAHLKGVN